MQNSQTETPVAQRYFLIGTLLILLVVLMMFISPFAANMLIAAVIVTAVYPLHKLLSSKIHIPKTFSALLSLLIVFSVVLLPFVLFIFFIANQATDAYIAFSHKLNIFIQSGEYNSVSKIISKLPFSDKIQQVMAYSPLKTEDVLKSAGDLVGFISSFLLSQTTSILKHLSLLIVHAIVFLLTMFYFLRDGKKLVDYLHSLMPLSDKYRSALFIKLGHLSRGIIYGIFGAAILQGILVGVGFAIVGIGSPAFWGAIAALFSAIPYIGTSIVWIPGVIALLIGGKVLLAVLLTIWCIFVVGLSDNIIKPYVIGSASSLHPLAVLLVLIGGVFAFGTKGLIFGPFVLTLTLAFLHIYQLEYKSVLKTPDLKVTVSSIEKSVKKK